MKYGRRALALGTIGAALAVASPAMAMPGLTTGQAHRVADGLALNVLDPSSVLPAYSAATEWDGTSDGRDPCTRFGRYQVWCVASPQAENYYYDDVAGDYTGFAYCVVTVKVTKNQWTGRVSSRLTGFRASRDCDSTQDYGY